MSNNKPLWFKPLSLRQVCYTEEPADRVEDPNMSHTPLKWAGMGEQGKLTACSARWDTDRASLP